MAKNYDIKAQVLGISFFSKDKAELLIEIEQKTSHSRNTTYIFTPNPEQVVLAQENQEFQACLQRANIRIPDGIGVVWAANFLSWRHKSLPITERISGADLTIDVLKLVHQKNWRALVIGGRNYRSKIQQQKNNSAQPISIHLDKQISNLDWLVGYEQISSPSDQEEQVLTQAIETIRPEVIFVAFGAPEQEKWALGHRDLLEKAGVKLVLVVGGTFDYLTGQVPRAPKWLQTLGLEWLFRLIQEPWRWKRQLKLLKFIYLVGQEFFSR